MGKIIILSNSLSTITLGVCLKTFSGPVRSTCCRMLMHTCAKMRKEGLHSLRWTTATGIGQCCPAIGVSQVDICFGAQQQACNCGVIKVFATKKHPEWSYRWTFSRCVPYRPAGLELKHCRILDKRDLMGLKTSLELTNCRRGTVASFPSLFFSSITCIGIYRL